MQVRNASPVLPSLSRGAPPSRSASCSLRVHHQLLSLSIGQVGPTERPVTPLVRGRQAGPEITVHDPLDVQVPHPLLHHHIRVNTLHKSIAQNIGRPAYQILADHVQNLVLESDEVGDGK